MSNNTLGKPFALGRTAEMYAWGNGHVLKLFRDWCPPTWVEHEARIARVVHTIGLPVPAVGDLIQVNGRRGIIYERVRGRSMLQTILFQPWAMTRMARQLAELHAAMHNLAAPDLPSQRQQLRSRIERVPTLPADVRSAVLAALDQLPDGDRLCHNDFHPDNVMMTARGPIIIDWTDAMRGNPLADVARTLLLFEVGTPPQPLLRMLIDLVRRQFRDVYLEHYFRLRPEGRDQLAAWRPIIAAARLIEDIPGERERLIAQVRTCLSLRS